MHYSQMSFASALAGMPQKQKNNFAIWCTLFNQRHLSKVFEDKISGGLKVAR
jgi:hypothetical protein